MNEKITNEHKELLRLNKRTFITTLEKALRNTLGRDFEFEKVDEPIKLGDVPKTYVSINALYEAVGFKPDTPLEEGLQKFAEVKGDILDTVYAVK
ncbi:MAG TPA: hypothetical protein VK136_05440 [Bacillota bacterium]|nr:hypothetical protein [Bacillota bacterium]